jgi:hydrogenase expression/formation protein HypE
MVELFGECPLPVSAHEHILLGHGGGGRLTADLLKQVFLPSFQNEILGKLEDQATLTLKADSNGALKLAFTTDSFVVRPLFFPGGDIGKLAVYGTVNDLAVGGAKPLFISAAFIIEEGLPLEDLKRVVKSMQEACTRSGVMLVTGDTKVVDRGKGDQLFINTSGIGVISKNYSLSIENARPGDLILVSGTIGDHGMAIMSVREGIEFETQLQSDCAPLTSLVQMMLEVCPTIRCIRDPTRGGVAAVLNELAVSSQVGVWIKEESVPLASEVKGACEILGLDPLYVANEGKLIAVVPSEHSDQVLDAMRKHPLGIQSAIIGQVVDTHPGKVLLKSKVGGERILMLLEGDQLPRIC